MMKLDVPLSKYLRQNLLSALSFSHSGQFCALTTRQNILLLIYRVKEINNIDSWELLQTLHQQTQTISEVDWSKDDKIITASHDRSAFIFRKTGNSKWEKMLVNIDIKLSILCAKWAPSAKKFALGSSCRTVSIGFFNVQSNCWTVSLRQKITKSPITTIAFHPSSSIVAIGSSDNSVKLITCSFKKSKDPFIQKSDIQDNSYQGPFQNVDTLFDVLVNIENLGGWINHLSFELNGSFLLALPHSNHFKVFDIIDQQNSVGIKQIDIKWNGLPFLSGFISDKGILYTGGFDKKVAVFTKSTNGFTFNQNLQKNQKSKTEVKKGLVSNMLSGIEKKGNTFGNPPSISQHLNSIKVVPSPNRKYIVSYDVNGVIHFWE